MQLGRPRRWGVNRDQPVRRAMIGYRQKNDARAPRRRRSGPGVLDLDVRGLRERGRGDQQ